MLMVDYIEWMKAQEKSYAYVAGFVLSHFRSP